MNEKKIVSKTRYMRPVPQSLEKLLRQIVANVGSEPSVVLNKVPECKGSFGYNAASIASLILTMDVLVAELPKDDVKLEAVGEMGM